MGRRKAGSLIPLKVQILEIVSQQSESDELYGFALAKSLSDGDRVLTSHGTLYKALARLAEAGLVTAEWESPELAEAAKRPRRRHYRITGEGQKALDASRAAVRPPVVIARTVNP